MIENSTYRELVAKTLAHNGHRDIPALIKAFQATQSGALSDREIRQLLIEGVNVLRATCTVYNYEYATILCHFIAC